MSHKTDEIMIQLPRDAYDDLAALTRHIEKLGIVAECVAACDVAADNPTIVSCLVQKAGMSEADARHVLYGLLNLLYLRQDMQISGEELLEVVTRHLQERAPEQWKKDNLVCWCASQAKLAEALCERNPVAILEKARRLQYAYEHVLKSARVLTDVRPVFDDDADEMLGGIVTHSLVVEYTENRTLKRAHFALDTSDVVRLKLQCERAERKAATAETVLKSVLGRASQEGAPDER